MAIKDVLTGMVIGSVCYVAGIGTMKAIDYFEPKQQTQIQIPSKQERRYTLERCIDGDTIVVEEGVEVLLKHIRLLGIDTPEKGEPFYDEATTALKNLIAGRKIYLEKDPQKDIGNFGRPLRYIIKDGKNINVELVRLGLAKADRYKGLKYEAEILAAQEEAQEAGRGIWGKVR